MRLREVVVYPKQWDTNCVKASFLEVYGMRQTRILPKRFSDNGSFQFVVPAVDFDFRGGDSDVIPAGGVLAERKLILRLYRIETVFECHSTCDGEVSKTQ